MLSLPPPSSLDAVAFKLYKLPVHFLVSWVNSSTWRLLHGRMVGTDRGDAPWIFTLSPIFRHACIHLSKMKSEECSFLSSSPQLLLAFREWHVSLMQAPFQLICRFPCSLVNVFLSFCSSQFQPHPWTDEGKSQQGKAEASCCWHQGHPGNGTRRKMENTISV